MLHKKESCAPIASHCFCFEMHLPFIVSISSVSHSKANCLQAPVMYTCRPIYRVLVTMRYFTSPESLTLEMVLPSPSPPICVTGCSLGRARVTVRGIRASGCGEGFSPGKGNRHSPTCRSSLCRSGRWPRCPPGLNNVVNLGPPVYVPREDVFLWAPGSTLTPNLAPDPQFLIGCVPCVGGF